MSLFVGRDSYPASFGASFAASGLKGKSGPAWLADFLLGTTSGVLPSGVSVSSPSLGGLVTDATGKLTYKPNNLVSQSQALATTPWSGNALASLTNGAATDPNGIPAASIIEDTSTGRHYTVQQISTAQTNGGTFVFSANMKANGRNGGLLFIDNAAGNISVFVNLLTGAVSSPILGQGNVVTWNATSGSTSLGNGWWKVYVVVTPTYTSATNLFPAVGPSNKTSGWVNTDISYTGDGASGIYATAYQVERVTYETTPRAYNATGSGAYYGPAWDHDSSGNPLGLRVWESRTNLVTYSSALTNAAWTKTTATISAATGLDGTSSANLIVPTTGASAHSVYQLVTISAATNTWSIYARAAGYNFVYLSSYDGSDHLTWFNLTNGTVGTNAAGNTATILPVGNGWYRCTVTRSAASTGGAFTVSPAPADNVNSFAGDGTSGVLVYGAQLELASTASPYIPSSSAAVTAAADVVTLNGVPLALLQGANVSAVAEYQWSTGNGNVLTLAPVGPGSFITMLASGGSGGTGWYAGGLSPGNIVAGAVNRMGIAFDKVGDFKAAANGGSIVSSSASDYTGQSTTGYLGSWGSSRFLNGYIRKLAIWNTRLPDATLQAKTVSGASF